MARAIVLAAWAVVFPLPSCLAVSAGPVATQSVGDHSDATSVGGRVSVFAQCARDRGPALGGEMQSSFRVDEAGEVGPDHRALGLLLGYSSTPLPHRPSPWGIDAFLAAGIGTHARGAGTARGAYGGPRIGIPIRLTKQRMLWNAQDRVGWTHMIVPSFDWTLVYPSGGGLSDVGSEAAVGIAYRAHIWSALVP